MQIIGLAGGSGTGKTTIAEHLAARGARHIDTDRIGHRLLDDPQVSAALVSAFGAEILIDGAVDRHRLAQMVFDDPSRLQQLNSIIHPRIVDECARLVAQYEEEGADLVVVDAALLLDVPMSFKIDMTIALTADHEERVRRLLSMGHTREQIEARLRNQQHIEATFDRADVVVDAGRPKEVVFAEIDRLIETGSDTD